MAELAYDRRGSGEPLLLLHGVGMRRKAWAPVIAPLAAEAATRAGNDRDPLAAHRAGVGSRSSCERPASAPLSRRRRRLRRSRLIVRR